MRRNPTVEYAKRLRDRGRSISEIARLVDRTPAQVRTMLCDVPQIDEAAAAEAQAELIRCNEGWCPRM